MKKNSEPKLTEGIFLGDIQKSNSSSSVVQTNINPNTLFDNNRLLEIVVPKTPIYRIASTSYRGNQYTDYWIRTQNSDLVATDACSRLKQGFFLHKN